MRVPTSDQLAVFLAIIRGGSTLAAARHLRLDHGTVSRKLAALERDLAIRLFDRSPRGLAPTAAGIALVEGAERVESALLSAADGIGERDSDVRGTVRLATPEMFGTHVIAPHLAELRERHPALLIELAPESRSVSLSKREADIAIMLRRPPRGRLVARKLGSYRIGLYAGRRYLENHGPVEDIGDLGRHGFVSYIDELVPFPELVALDEVHPCANVSFRSSSSAAQQAAVAGGAGLGMLHVYAADRDPDLVRVLRDRVDVTRTYWLALHTDLQRVSRVRTTIDFVERCVERSAALR